MLDIALQFLKDELASYFTARIGIPATPVEVKLTKMVDEAGKYAFLEETVAISIVNIEEERVIKEHLPRYTTIDNQQSMLEPELRLNIYVVFAAYFKQYSQALKYLGHIMTFFQSHPWFTADRYPSLDSRIEKLVPELQSLNYEQMNQVWATIGGKQLPSMVYKIRMVVLQDEQPSAVQPPVGDLATNIHAT